jgi:hypothetical protein
MTIAAVTSALFLAGGTSAAAAHSQSPQIDVATAIVERPSAGHILISGRCPGISLRFYQACVW